MTTVLFYLVVAAVIGLVVFFLAVFVFGRGEQMAPLDPRTSPAELPEKDITADDVRRIRFALALRGYRMSDVDWTLERLGEQLDELRRENARLRGDDGFDAGPADLPDGRTGLEPGLDPSDDPGIDLDPDFLAREKVTVGAFALQHGGTAPDRPMPDGPAPGETARGETARGETARGETARGGTASVSVVPVSVRPASSPAGIEPGPPDTPDGRAPFVGPARGEDR